MKTTYTFTVLRYVHDVTTGEFVNVGLALYAPEAKYVSALCSSRYGRLTKMFLAVSGDHYCTLMRYVQARFDEFAEKLQNELALDGAPKSIMEIAQAILPADDSSLQWSEPGGGVTDDPSKTLEALYVRMVQRYEERQQLPSPEDEEIWKDFRKSLETHHVLAHLHTKRIIAKDYDYEFQHARKNEVWHMYEPLSLDLIHAESILDKANRWFGRVFNLQDSEDKFALYMLLGEPRDDKLKGAFVKAKNILHKMPVKHEFVSEHEASKFSSELAEEIKKNVGDSGE